MLSGSHPQFCRGAERVLPQRVRARLGVQLLQSVHRRGRDVPSRRDPRDVTDQSAQATIDAQFARVERGPSFLLLGGSKKMHPVTDDCFHIMQFIIQFERVLDYPLKF